MSFIIKAAKTAPVRIDIDMQTDAGRLKGYFTGHAFTHSKAEMAKLSDWINRLANYVKYLNGEEDAEDPSAEDRNDFADVTPENADELMLRKLYARFEGLEDETGPLEGEAAFNAVLNGPLSLYLFRAASEAYWSHLADARSGNAQRRRVR